MLRFFLLADALPEGDKMLGAIATAVAAIIVALVRAFAKERKQTIANLTRAAYMATTEVALLTPNTIDDKAAYALGVLNEMLAAEGAASLTSREKDRAELQWKAMHGAEKLQEKLQVLQPAPAPSPAARRWADPPP